MRNDHWFIRFGAGVLLTCVIVLLWAWRGAAPFPDKAAPMEGSVVATKIIETSMTELAEVARDPNMPPDYLRVACILEGLDSWLTKSFDTLERDPILALQVRQWRNAYWDGLTHCARGDFAGANSGLADAYKSLQVLTGRSAR